MVREVGRVVPVHALIATGVKQRRRREFLGLQVTTADHGAGREGSSVWRDLRARGPAIPAISD
jgi:transposase-like protein